MAVRGGRLEFLVPHLLRSQLLRPAFVRLSLKLGAARQMPAWAKLQFLNNGVSAEELDAVLGRITSLISWVDEWEALGRTQEEDARRALAAGNRVEARSRYLAASASYNFGQYVMFMDILRKRQLHAACVNAYAQAAPLLDPPAEMIEIAYRRRVMRGYLRVPASHSPVPVVVMFNGTNAVKEELHWWTESFLARGLATLTFDGPGLGETFHRLSMVAEPRPVGLAIVNHLQTRSDIDPDAIALFGQSLGGYLVIRMAAADTRIRAVAAVSPPFSADVYWNVTLAALRRELAALYGMQEGEMGKEIHRITLAETLPKLRCPLIVSGGGHDLITPGEEAWRIYDTAQCERELVFYPRAGHDCFNVLADLRPRMASWMARQLADRRKTSRNPVTQRNGEIWMPAAEAVDPDFADALRGEAVVREWHRPERRAVPARWRAILGPGFDDGEVEVVLRRAERVVS